MREYVTKDSGDRREFATGSVRDMASGKGHYRSIPTAAIRRLAQLYERGAVKYGDNNWRKGQPIFGSFFDSAFRHLMQWAEGEPTEDHLAAVLWNVCGIVWTLDEIEAGRLPRELDDRPPPEPRHLPKVHGPETFDAPSEPSGPAFNESKGEQLELPFPGEVEIVVREESDDARRLGALDALDPAPGRIGEANLDWCGVCALRRDLHDPSGGHRFRGRGISEGQTLEALAVKGLTVGERFDDDGPDLLDALTSELADHFARSRVA